MEENKNKVTQEESYKSGSIQYIDSREVAEMIEKKHKDLMRDIRRYCQYLEKGNVDFNQRKIAPVDFFAEASYQDAKGEKRPCYLVTQKGCEFIAHKLTGEKGAIFTATYINRFHEMEDSLDAQIIPILQQFIEQQIEMSKRQEKFTQMIMDRQEKPGNGMAKHQTNPYSSAMDSIIESRKRELYGLTAKVVEMYGGSQTKVLHYMYQSLERDLGIVLDSYKSVYRSETGRQNASMVEVIAANDWIYQAAVEMNRSVIEEKQIYG